MKRLIPLLLVGLVATATGCPMASDDNTTTGGGAAGGGGAGGGTATGPWSCLGEVEGPAFMAGQSAVTFTVAEFPSGTTVSEATVGVCAATDTSCAMLVDEGTTDEEGNTTISVPTDQAYYFPVSGDGLAPALFFRRGLPPPTDPFAVEIGVLSQGTLDAFMGIVGTTPDAARGHLVITVRDCDAALAEGLRVEVSSADASSTIAYLDGGVPSSSRSVTDASGRAGVLNLPAGPVTVTSFRAETDERVGERTLFIEPGVVSYVGVVPSP